MSSRTGLDPLELAVLRGLRDVGALSNQPHCKNSRTLEEIEKTQGFGPRYMFDVLCDLSRKWECILPLVDFHGNNGDGGEYPAAPPNVTESRLSQAGALALTVEESASGALPIRFINGTLYRGGTAPALEPSRVVECLQQLCANPEMDDQEITNALGNPCFYEDPILDGDVDALYAGETVACTLTARITIVGTSARGMTVSVTNFPPQTTAYFLAEDLEHHTSEEAWRLFHEDVYEDEPRLPIKAVSDLSRGSISTGHHEVQVKVERGVDMDMFVEALATHRLVRDEIMLAFPQSVPSMMRKWVQEHNNHETLANLAALKSLLPYA